jgi:hypothetical protein
MALALTRAPRPASGLFPSYLAGGFECSTPVNFQGTRIDELVATGHDAAVEDDYRRLRQIGIRTVRDGVRWNLVDRAGNLDFSSALPYVEAAERLGMTVIWDLFHYGYPPDLDPFECDDFAARFKSYCREFARLLVERGRGALYRCDQRVRFYTVANEISFFAWAGGEVGMFAPHAQGRGAELKSCLAAAAIAAMDGILEVDPGARFVHSDPIVHVVAPADAPWLQHEADYFNAHFVTEAWDMLAGRVQPELGGHPRYLDILGVNYYGVNQWEHGRPGNVLADDDPRRVSFSDLLIGLHHQYHRPLFVAETSSTGADRPRWLRRIAHECERAMEHGVELHGLCIYPVMGMADWDSGEFRAMGLWDFPADDPTCRIPDSPTLRVIAELQQRYTSAGVRRRRIENPAQVAMELSA